MFGNNRKGPNVYHDQLRLMWLWGLTDSSGLPNATSQPRAEVSF